ncbi:hypothetical protein Tco_0298394 [Tanacetum coccineum]
MGGSSSQRRTNPPMSPIHAFPIRDMYTPEFLDSFQQNTSSFQEIAREDSPVEVATSPPKMKKPTRGRQKRTIQSDYAPRQIVWTNEEEIVLCIGWVYVFENSSVGNTRKDAGFWSKVLQYMERKTKQYGRRTYDMESGASDEDYYARALVDYEAKTGTTFKLRHFWEVLKCSPKWIQSKVPKFSAKSGGGSKRYKSSGSSSFNTEYGEASINLNAIVGDDEEDEVQEI